MKFIEKVDAKKCQFLLTMKKGDFETSFPKSDDLKCCANTAQTAKNFSKQQV